MELNEVTITRAIITSYFRKMLDSLEVDVCIVGGGPAGMIAGYYLAKAGKRVSLYERKLSPGGGMWGGGMMFNEIVVQEDALGILDEMGIRYARFQDNYFTADSVEAVSCIIMRACKARRQGFQLHQHRGCGDARARNHRPGHKLERRRAGRASR